MNFFLLFIIMMISSMPLEALEQDQKKIFFSLQDILSEKVLTEEDLPNEPYIIHFWSSWCLACSASHDNMYVLGQKYPIVGVVIQDDVKKIKDWSEEHSHPYLYLLDDQEASLALDLNVPFAPCTLFVDGHGMVIRSQAGLLEDPYDFVYQ